MKIIVTNIEGTVVYEGEGMAVTCTEEAPVEPPVEPVEPVEPVDPDEATPYPDRPGQGLPGGLPGGAHRPSNPIVKPPMPTPKR
jgi:hypothetical protein